MKYNVYYPILFSINPILLLFAVNLNEITISQLFPVVILSPLTAAGLIWLLNKYLNNYHRSGYIIFILSFWFFHYGTVRLYLVNAIYIGNTSIGAHLIFFPIWSMVFILLGSSWLWRRITSPITITRYLNIFCVALICLSLYRITRSLIPQYFINRDENQTVLPIPDLSLISNLPDIYYIILDGYAREDVLREIYHYDNADFINALEDRGFFVAAQSQSNYIQTTLSLASSLNMEYLSNLPVGTIDRGPLIGMIRQNRTQAVLKQLGYITVSFSTGFLPTELTNADNYFTQTTIRESQNLNALILYYSPVIILIENGWFNLPLSRFRDQQARINYTFETISKFGPQISSPKFVFAHITAPHPPFIFNRGGSINPEEYYILVDGFNLPGGTKAYIRGYIDQLIYVNKQILNAVDGILATSKSPPVIIIQSDHGPGAYLDWGSAENTCLKERFSILNALYLPQGGSNLVPENLTPVNTFSIILNKYFGTQIELLDNKNYFSTLGNPYNLVDLSSSSQVTCDIP